MNSFRQIVLLKDLAISHSRKYPNQILHFRNRNFLLFIVPLRQVVISQHGQQGVSSRERGDVAARIQFGVRPPLRSGVTTVSCQYREYKEARSLSPIECIIGSRNPFPYWNRKRIEEYHFGNKIDTYVWYKVNTSLERRTILVESMFGGNSTV